MSNQGCCFEDFATNLKRDRVSTHIISAKRHFFVLKSTPPCIESDGIILKPAPHEPRRMSGHDVDFSGENDQSYSCLGQRGYFRSRHIRGFSSPFEDDSTRLGGVGFWMSNRLAKAQKKPWRRRIWISDRMNIYKGHMGRQIKFWTKQ
jgi:hypothetical protein